MARFVVGDRSIASLAIVEDVETLDQGHVRPTMGNIFIRGVWWPRGYEHIASRAPGLGYLIPFHAILDVSDPNGVHKRATLLAADLVDAKARFEAEFGSGTVISLWVDPEFERPRG